MPTLDQLNALANDIPVLNDRAAKAAQAAAATRQQQAVQQTNLAGTGVTATQAAQAAAPAGVTAQVQPLVQAQQQTTQALTQVGATGVQAQQTADTDANAVQQRAVQAQLAQQQNAQQLAQVNADLTMRKRVTANEQQSAQRLQAIGIEQDNKLQFMTIRQRQQLAALGGDVQAEIQTSRLQFERDDMGRKFTDQRQLSDYLVANAATDIDFKQKMQDMGQMAERKIQLLEVSEAKIRQMVTQGFQSSEQQLDNQQKAKLIDLAVKLKKAQDKANADAKNHTAAIQAGGTIIGAVVGFGVSDGNPAGAMVGAAVGGGVGTLVAGTGILNPLFGGEGHAGTVSENQGPPPSTQPTGGSNG